MNAGGKVTLHTGGAGKDSVLTIAGSDVAGKSGTILASEGDMNILAVDENHLERSKNKASGFNAGVAISYGSSGFAFGVTAGGNVAKGYGNGESQAWLGSQVGSGDSRTDIVSGGDTRLIGSQVRGKKVKIDTENLHIESVQDTMSYEGKQMNMKGQATVGYGASVSGSYNQSKTNAKFANVNEQSGIFAGDSGYSVNIRKHSDLTGAIITSSEKAEQEGKNQFSTNTLTYQDIQNYAQHNAEGFGLSGGVTVSGGDAPKEIGGVKLQQVGQNHANGASKVELGGIAGVGTQGNWGIAKGLATGLLGQVKDKSNEKGITTSSINTANILIRDDNAQRQLTGKNAEETANDIHTFAIHQSVSKIDIEKVKSNLERDLNTAMDFMKNLNEIGDDIYHHIEKNEGNILVKEKRQTDCDNIECVGFHELDVDKLTVPQTREEAEKLQRMYVHGIMNENDKDRIPGAIQYGGEDYLENDVLVVRKPYTTVQSELTYTIFERLRAGIALPSILGASNASREQAKIWGLLEEYNRNNPNDPVDLKHLSHSLGVSSTKNAMNWAEHQGIQFKNTTLQANTVGTSYPMSNKTIGGKLSGGFYDQGYSEMANKLFQRGTVEYASSPRDLVSTGMGLPFQSGNLSIGIGNTNTTGNNKMGIPLLDMLSGAHTTAYYKGETVIRFLNSKDNVNNKENIKVEEIKNYQKNIWGQIGPKTEKIEFNNGKVIDNKESK